MIAGLAAAMMELLKIHLVASYLGPAFGLPIRFTAYSLLFLAVFLLNRALSARRMRIIGIWLANAAVCAAFFLLLRDPGHLIVSLAAILVFHGRAWWLAASEIDHEFCVTRFDEGLALYLVTLTIAAFVKVENPFPLQATLPFFAFSILSLGLAQGRKVSGNARFSKSHNAALASSTIAMTLSAIGVAGLVPLTFAPAKKVGAVLGSLSLRILSIIGDIFEWLFRARKPVTPSFSGNVKDGIVYAERGAEEVGTSTIFMWVVIGIFGIGMVLLAGYAVAHLLRYLFSETGPRTASKRHSLKMLIAGLLRRIRSFKANFAKAARRASAWIAQRKKSESAALRAYRKLLAVGKLSGAPRKRNETPREYAARLAAVFPGSAGPGIHIVEAVEREIYGAIVPDSFSLRAVESARLSLKRRKFLAERMVRFRTAAVRKLKKT